MKKELTDEERKIVEKVVKLSKKELNEEEIIKQIIEDFPQMPMSSIQQTIEDHTTNVNR